MSDEWHCLPFQFEFEDFAVEISQDCIYDAVVIYDDTEEEHEIGRVTSLVG